MIAKNTICRWHEGGMEDATRFYAATFPETTVGEIMRTPSDYPGGRAGDVLTV